MRNYGRSVINLLLCTVLLLMIPVVAGCGVTPEEEQPPEEVEAPLESDQPSRGSDAESKSADETTSVDKRWLDVEITLPPSMFEDVDMSEAIRNAEEGGVTEVIINDDGSITYIMPRSVHSDMMSDMRRDMLESIEEMKAGDDYLSIRDIRCNADFSEFTVVVDKAAFQNSFDGFVGLNLWFLGAVYQSFDGVDTEEIRVSVLYENEDTGEVFTTVVYPDALDE